MKSRVLASVALCSLVALGATGCNMISPQATTIPYSASDGANIPESSGPVHVRNALVVANEAGTAGNFVAVLSNPTDSEQVVKVALNGGSGPALTINVPAKSSLSLGGTDAALPFPSFDSLPGSTVEAFVQSGNGEGVVQHLQVFDNTLPHFETLAPTS